MGDSAYSFSLTTFSPQGKLLQIDYAMQAVNKVGGIAIGIKASDGICLVTERRSIPLLDVESAQKMQTLDEHVGCVYSGMVADARLLFTKARQHCQQYKATYGIPIPVGQLVRKIADCVQEYTQSNGVRPFGCCLLVSGVDDMGHHLYQIDPSGLFIAWKATAIGKGAPNAKTTLEKRYTADMEVEDAIGTAIKSLENEYVIIILFLLREKTIDRNNNNRPTGVTVSQKLK